MGTPYAYSQAVFNRTADATVTIKFNYTSGDHGLKILGVDLVNAEGTIISHYETKTEDNNGAEVYSTYTLSNVPVGNYTLRYYVESVPSSNQVDKTNGNITVTGLEQGKFISSVSELSNDKVYVIKSGRTSGNNTHYLLYHTAATDNLSSTYGSGHTLTYTKTTTNFHFAIQNRGGKYYFYNMAGGKFIGNNSANNGAIPLVLNPTNDMEIRDCTSESADYCFKLSTNGWGALNCAQTANCHGVVNWNDGYNEDNDAGNRYQIIEIGDLPESDKTMMASKIFPSQIASLLPLAKLVGPGLGKYSYSGEVSVSSTITEAERITAEGATPTLSEMETCATKLLDIERNVTINQPEVGKLYRFKGKVSGKYMASPSNSANKMTLHATSANGAETVFWLKKNESGDKILQSFGNGYYVTETHTAKAQKASANTISFIAAKSGNLGYYTLMTNYSSPYMYDDNKDTEVDRNSTYVANNCDWTIEEVTWLPIPVTNGYSKLGTFVSPVDLVPNDNRLKFYTGVIKGDYLSVTKYEGNVIPAETPFLIEYQDKEISEYKNGCYYLQISNTDAQFSGDNDLRGGLETVTKASVQGNNTIYTLQKTGTDPENDKQEFRRYTGTDIKGFRAYLPVPANKSIRVMIFGGQTTYIEGAPTEETAAPIVYDLIGRRVQHVI